jgi:hypothetical protein
MLDLLIITEFLKAIHKKMKTSLKEKSEKWSKTDCHRNNATKTEVEIDNYCESCKTAKCNAIFQTSPLKRSSFSYVSPLETRL